MDSLTALLESLLAFFMDAALRLSDGYAELSTAYPGLVVPVAGVAVLVLVVLLFLVKRGGARTAPHPAPAEPPAPLAAKQQGAGGSQSAFAAPAPAGGEAVPEEPRMEAVAAPEQTAQEQTAQEPPPPPPSQGLATPAPAPEADAPPESVEEAAPPEPVPSEDGTVEGLFARLRKGLSKTHDGLLGTVGQLLASRKEINSELWEEFEEALVMADLGISTTMKLRSRIEDALGREQRRAPESVMQGLKEEILTILKGAEATDEGLGEKPHVVMVVGVNGAGKTTTIGKLANRYAGQGRKVMVAAADTFRAAAVEQLEVWSKRVGCDFIKGQTGADPSAVAFDSVKAAVSRGADVLIIDTAGRLHTKTNLMDQLRKMARVVGKEMEGAPHETLLVLDSTTGQNAVQQAKLFRDAIEVTGIVLTKLDGTAKGGVIVAIADELGIPVRYIGIGEGLGDLRPFDAEEFVEALFISGHETLH